MSRAVLICGSPREKGNTMSVLEVCAEVLERNGVAPEIVNIGNKGIVSCIGCRKCADTGKCISDDYLNEVLEKVRASEGLIVGSPVYFGTARGDVMSALQRLGMVSKAHDRYLSRKIGGPIAVARRGGHTSTIQEMLMFFLINDMIVPGSTYWNIVFGRHPGEALSDEEGISTIKRFAENTAFLINKLH